MSLADSAMTRDVLRDIAKHPVDASELQVHVQHGVIYMTGRIGRIRGHFQDIDLTEELNMIVRVLRHKPGIRDVCCDVEFVGLSAEQRAAGHPQRYHSHH